jgi:hypothetical protein
MPETVKCSRCKRTVPERTAVEEEWAFDPECMDEASCAECFEAEQREFPLSEILRQLCLLGDKEALELCRP